MDIHWIYRFVGQHFRRRRLARFKAMFPAECCATICDLGGGGHHGSGHRIMWDEIGYPSDITLVNIHPQTVAGKYRLTIRDARNTGFADRSFSLAYSNSLIEHLGSFDDQKTLAGEMRRISGQIWCQTPNRWFPIEPHYLAPLFHWLPRSWQKPWMVRYFGVWGWAAHPDRQVIEGVMREVRLLSRAELKQLFPDCEILTERFLGLPKSLIAVKRSPVVTGFGT